MALATLLPNGGVTVDPAARILKADEYGRIVEASEALAEAGRQAADLLEATKRECEELRRQAVRDGLAEGKAEIALRMLDSVTASVEGLASTEASLVDVVMRSIRTILGEFDREDLATRVVAHALRLVRDEKRILLRVSPEDADAVNGRIGDIVKRYPGMGRVDVASDAALEPGACILETDVGVVDAGLERQLSMIEETFRRHVEERSVT